MNRWEMLFGGNAASPQSPWLVLNTGIIKDQASQDWSTFSKFRKELKGKKSSPLIYTNTHTRKSDGVLSVPA